jgi:hypothetical protein
MTTRQASKASPIYPPSWPARQVPTYLGMYGGTAAADCPVSSVQTPRHHQFFPIEPLATVIKAYLQDPAPHQLRITTLTQRRCIPVLPDGVLSLWK